MQTRGWWRALIGVMLALCMMTSVSAAATTHTDPQGRFSFTVPDGFQRVSISTLIAAQYVSPTFKGANVNIAIATVPGGTTLVPLIPTKAQLEPLIRMIFGPGSVDFSPSGFGAATVAGHPAVQDTYTITATEGRFRGEQFLLLDGTTEYVITFTANVDDFDGFLKESRIVLDTFTILRASPSTFIRRLGDG